MRGVRQGCTPSPTLFGLYTDDLAVRMRRTGIRVGDDSLCCMLYADDIVIMSKFGEELQRILDAVSERFQSKIQER